MAHAGMESQSAGLEEVSEPVDLYPRGRASREQSLWSELKGLGGGGGQ